MSLLESDNTLITLSLAWSYMPTILTLKKLTGEDWEFKTNLSNIMRSYLKN